MSKMVEVVALRRGYINGRTIEPGDIFEIERGKMSKRWMAEKGTDGFKSFLSHHDKGAPKTDAVTGERLASGGIAEELAVVTGERNRLRAEVAEVKAELELLRSERSMPKQPTQSKAEDEAETVESEPATRVRRRIEKKEG